jgi:hypothetical protein
MQKINRETKIIILFLMLIAVIASAIAAYFNIAYAGKIFPNIAINGEDYSGLTKEQAFLKLENGIKAIYKNDFSFTYENNIFKTSILKTGSAVDINETVNNAFYYGHSENIFQNIKEQITLINKKKNFQIRVVINEEEFENYIKKELSEIETPPKDFSYVYDDEKFTPIMAETGIIIDRNKLKKDISKNLTTLKNDDLKIELVEAAALVKEDLNDRALIQANNLLNKKVVLKYNSDKFEVQKEDLASWIKFGVVDKIWRRR